jgi:carbonic anhydrase
MTLQLLRGLSRFKHEHFPELKEHYQRLMAEGQRPHTLFIGCADSRVLPDQLTDSKAGDLFVVRNVGNLVPPYETAEGYHGVSAAIEFAVGVLEVKDIVVCGHSHCGAISGLYRPPKFRSHHLEKWLELARPAMIEGVTECSEEILRRTEQRSIVLQLDHILTFPLVKERVESGAVALHGWHYIIETGTVQIFDIASGSFKALGEY